MSNPLRLSSVNGLFCRGRQGIFSRAGLQRLDMKICKEFDVHPSEHHPLAASMPSNTLWYHSINMKTGQNWNFRPLMDMWGASERLQKPGDVLSLGGTVKYRIFRYDTATLKDQLQGTNCLSHGGNTETLCSLFECHLFQLINVQVFRVRIRWIIRRPNLNKIMMWYQSMRIQANLQVRRILHNGHDAAVRLIPVGFVWSCKPKESVQFRCSFYGYIEEMEC